MGLAGGPWLYLYYPCWNSVLPVSMLYPMVWGKAEKEGHRWDHSPERLPWLKAVEGQVGFLVVEKAATMLCSGHEAGPLSGAPLLERP